MSCSTASMSPLLAAACLHAWDVGSASIRSLQSRYPQTRRLVAIIRVFAKLGCSLRLGLGFLVLFLFFNMNCECFAQRVQGHLFTGLTSGAEDSKRKTTQTAQHLLTSIIRTLQPPDVGAVLPLSDKQLRKLRPRCRSFSLSSTGSARPVTSGEE